MDLHFCIFCILLLATKMDLHFICILIFGVHFSVAFVLHFSAFISTFMFSRKRHSPTTQRHNFLHEAKRSPVNSYNKKSRGVTAHVRSKHALQEF